MLFFARAPALRPLHAVALAICGLACSAVQAQDYPAKPVMVVNGFAPGGSVDAAARPVAAKLAEYWKQSVVVENRPGAGGNTANEFVVRAARDGHVIAATGVGSVTINPFVYKSMRFNPLEDLTPVIRLGDAANVLVIPADLPVKSLEELIAYGKANPGKLSYGSTGVGTSSHLASFLLMSKVGVQAVHVPYKGADAVRDLLAGRIDSMFATVPTVIGFIRAGKLRALAVSTTQRVKILGEVPTVAESGFKDFDAGSWVGLFVPKGTPEAVVRKINADANRALKSAEVASVYEQQGTNPAGGTAQEFEAFVASEARKWKKVVEDSKASVD